MGDDHICKSGLEFQPDFFKKHLWIKRYIISIVIVSVFFTITWMVFTSRALESLYFALVCLLFATVLFAFIILMGTRSNTKRQTACLKYVITNTGVHIMKQGISLASYHWEEVEDIIILKGPCEPDISVIDPLVGMFYSGPYGIYLLMRANTCHETSIASNNVFNLALPHSLADPYNYSVLYLGGNISKKKCQQIKNMIVSKRTHRTEKTEKTGDGSMS